MPYINVNDAYIMDNTGKQVDDAVDYALANSNRNLLDNPWWGSGEVVNQRGVTSATVTNNTYFIDRWLTTYGSAAGTYSLGSAGLTLTPASGTTITVFQRLANAAAINGKTITLSAMMGNGTIYSGTIARTNGTAQVAFSNSAIALVMQSDNTFRVNVYSAQTVRAVKLELGSYSTLANDVAPDYKPELDKCQYRCVVYDLPGNFLFCRGIATSSTNIRGIIDLPTSMAGDRTPTISLTGSLTTPQGNTITAITAANTARNNKLAVNCTVSSVTSGNAYDIFTGSATPKIVISADL